jgi:uncharacterized protein (TIGR02001 family)
MLSGSRLQPLMAAALACSTSLTLAEDAPSPFSANVTLTTDYIYRGITQTNHQPAIQGGFSFNHASGVYASVWGSNVDFQDGDEANIEIDYAIGHAGNAGAFGWDANLTYLTYPGADSDLEYDSFELALTGSYDFEVALVSATIAHATDGMAAEEASYVAGDIEIPLPYGLAFGAHLGYRELELGVDYTNWKAALSTELAGIGLELAYTDTDLSREDCNYTDWCDSRFVFSLSKQF